MPDLGTVKSAVDTVAKTLASIACNRRCGGAEWKAWLDNPERWRLRHVEDGAFARIQQWQSEAA